jgi:hypothetical protein
VLRKYRKDRTFGVWNWQFDDLLTGEKDIHVIGVPNATMQGKVAVQLYHQQRLAFQLATGMPARTPKKPRPSCCPTKTCCCPCWSRSTKR